jgi:hypothetical protein
MKLLKKLNEDAAGGAVGGGGTGGASVAAHAMPLFSNLVTRTKKKSKRVKRITENEQQADTGSFDAAHVLSKLKGLEKKDKVDSRDTVTFGVEDENKNLIRVIVRSDQADSFEQALQSFLVNQDEQEPLDVAEMLFNLRNQFDIVDVVWPDIAEDEEQDLELAQQGGGAGGEDPLGMGGEGGEDPLGMGGEGGEDPLGMGGEGDMEAGMDAGGGMEDEKSLLTQIIDMMKADAEARKAEAIAKSAEAKAREASAAHAQILTKVKQEEQFLDMEAHNKQRKEAEREAKRLAQLARYKHEMSDERGDSFGSDEDYDPADVISAIGSKHKGSDEEEETLRRPQRVAAPKTGKRVLPSDVAKFILSRVK